MTKPSRINFRKPTISATPFRSELHDADSGTGAAAAHIAVSFQNGEVLVSLTSPKGRGVWPAVLSSMESNNFNIVEATLSTAEDTHIHLIRALIPDKVSIGSNELMKMLEALVYEKLRMHQERIDEE